MIAGTLAVTTTVESINLIYLKRYSILPICSEARGEVLVLWKQNTIITSATADSVDCFDLLGFIGTVVSMAPALTTLMRFSCSKQCALSEVIVKVKCCSFTQNFD